MDMQAGSTRATGTLARHVVHQTIATHARTVVMARDGNTSPRTPSKPDENPKPAALIRVAQERPRRQATNDHLYCLSRAGGKASPRPAKRVSAAHSQSLLIEDSQKVTVNPLDPLRQQ